MPSCTAIHDSQGLFCTETFNRKAMNINKTAFLRHQSGARLRPESSNEETRLEAGGEMRAFSTQPALPLFVLPLL